MRNAEVLEALIRIGIEYHPNISAVEALQKLRKQQDENVKAEIVSLAEECVHIVILTPPHYSDLQLIEFVWTKIKSSVGRMDNRDTTLSDLRARLEQHFEQLLADTGRDCVQNIIGHVN